jgi:hypothetical protein
MCGNDAIPLGLNLLRGTGSQGSAMRRNPGLKDETPLAFGIPKGFCPIAQGWREAATLGLDHEMIEPQRGSGFGRVLECGDGGGKMLEGLAG